MLKNNLYYRTSQAPINRADKFEREKHLLLLVDDMLDQVKDFSLDQERVIDFVAIADSIPKLKNNHVHNHELCCVFHIISHHQRLWLSYGMVSRRSLETLTRERMSSRLSAGMRSQLTFGLTWSRAASSRLACRFMPARLGNYSSSMIISRGFKAWLAPTFSFSTSQRSYRRWCMPSQTRFRSH